ncbi:MAG: hypothetical protein A2133_06255, partial [Actinobacteria bacterium RBG_16_64_13]
MRSSDSANKRTIWKDRKVVLSTLWVFLVLNFLYADIFTLFFDPAAQTQTSDLSSGAVFFFAVVMETAMLMVLLSRVLPQAWNRWSNIGAAILHTAVLVWSVTGSEVTSFYAFFVTVEIAILLFVIGYAWSWRAQRATQP